MIVTDEDHPPFVAVERIGDHGQVAEIDVVSRIGYVLDVRVLERKKSKTERTR